MAKIAPAQRRSHGPFEFANVLIPVNNDGTWKSDVILLNTSRELDRVIFTAEAVTVAGDGDTSDKAIVHFKK